MSESSTSFEDLYSHIAWWVDGAGWIEIGDDEYSDSQARVFDIGGLVYEGDDDESTSAALEAADSFIKRWREENGYL